MRVFLAGGSGLIGIRLIPLLLGDGHVVAAMTRTPERVGAIEALGAEAVLCDVYDRPALGRAVTSFGPDIVMHQLTDLPDDVARIPELIEANNRIRTEGTDNLLAAAREAGVSRLLAQSIAWPGGPAVEAHESTILAAGGVVLRYGRFYGPGTYFEDELPLHPRVHLDEAARRTMSHLMDPPGIVTIADPDVDPDGGTGG